ncbi:SAVMC3_10250 family protein [Streptomyces sp. AM8-1-1]|uniref:SAVMC3_10250 family protein n=1 Tax=Streptomyces sp. AM8-1-1 TaxID=3075825 RepID=UPI0028C4952F|nr:SAVMC3_10250 family protein [Streptomyces sp. AM8-1-1]WNO73091.1 SAVMC3_10250 family protein [Streptomyces sp. AM8-1-1]
MSEYREFVYLSDAKLQQFAQPRRRFFARPSAVRLTSPVGGVEVETPTADAERDRMRRLAKLDKYLGERAEWFGTQGLRSGQWVWFEAPLRCVTLRDNYQHMVLFVDPAPGEDLPYEQETGCRLLLHGSSRHLVGNAPVAVDGPALEDIDGNGSSIGTTFLTSAGHAVRALSLEHDPIADGVSAPSSDLTGSGVWDLLAAIDAHYAHAPGAWMRGLARVTKGLPATDHAARCLVASPLSVEYAHDQA